MGNTEILSFVTTTSINDSVGNHENDSFGGVGNSYHNYSHDRLNNSSNTTEV
jgi:hypothetical protein